MHNEFTDLLPQERQRAFKRDYYIRLSVVITVMISTLVLVAGVLLLPSYVFLSKSENTKKSNLASAQSTVSSVDEKNLSARLSELSSNIATLAAFGDTPSASDTIRDILNVTRSGVILSGLVYTSADGKKPRSLVVSGTAVTREALRSYQTMLQKSSIVRLADLPVSVYAKDSDISFNITLTLKP